jgi:phosphohistidine swiveling domain-containing protein
MVDSWIVDWTRHERLPYYTRANAGEVLPDPASPLGWTLVFEEGLLPGWYRGFVEFGIYGADEFNTPPRIPMVGIFGGYFYLNLSHMRLLGLRLGADLDKFDADLLGSHPDTPPYEPHPDDVRPELSAKAAATIGEILASASFPQIDEDRRRTARLVVERPDLATLSDSDLVARARSFAWELDNGFARHDYTSLASTLGPSILAGLCSSVGEAELQLELISGLGDVDSASASWGLWRLSREANASPEIRALFDDGPAAVLAALREPSSEAIRAFGVSFAEFMRESGSRGPNEWDIHSLSWEADPIQPLKLVNGIRAASDADSPQARHARLEARRTAAADRLRVALAGDAEALATLEMALASTSLCVPARERTKATCVAVINEVRMAVRELGRRGVAAGLFEKPEDVMMLMSDELDAYVGDRGSFRDVIAERLAAYEELFELDPPFIIASDPAPLSQWPRRAERRLSLLKDGDVLSGLGGGAGRYSGRVCILLDPSDMARLEPGDVLVAPFTDAAWTPLFLIAGAIVVDVGAMNSHAVVVSRELGIPAVLSVTTGTAQLADGMLVTVDGAAGTVTVDSTVGATGV